MALLVLSGCLTPHNDNANRLQPDQSSCSSRSWSGIRNVLPEATAAARTMEKLRAAAIKCGKRWSLTLPFNVTTDTWLLISGHGAAGSYQLTSPLAGGGMGYYLFAACVFTALLHHLESIPWQSVFGGWSGALNRSSWRCRTSVAATIST